MRRLGVTQPLLYHRNASSYAKQKYCAESLLNPPFCLAQIFQVTVITMDVFHVIFEVAYYYVLQDDLEPAILLPQLPKCWHYRSTPHTRCVGQVVFVVVVCLVNLTQARVAWKELQLRKCLHQMSCMQICRAFS